MDKLFYPIDCFVLDTKLIQMRANLVLIIFRRAFLSIVKAIIIVGMESSK